ncbi:hypothetical protein D1007_06296 [Hordeum vulgare]|nr:hypothetical protein D1007_06296 [Hordeum vulgare]
MAVKEHVEMAADLDTDLKWSHDDYVRKKIECQRHDRKEGGVIVLDEQMPTQTTTSVVAGNMSPMPLHHSPRNVVARSRTSGRPCRSMRDRKKAPRGQHNSDGHRQWWGVPERTLHAALEHMEGNNKPSLEYPASLLSRRSGSLWLPRQMAGSSSSSARSSDTIPPLPTMKVEPQETSKRRRSHDDNLVINEGRRQPSPPHNHLRLTRTKEPVTPPVAVKEHIEMAVDLDTA